VFCNFVFDSVLEGLTLCARVAPLNKLARLAAGEIGVVALPIFFGRSLLFP